MSIDPVPRYEISGQEYVKDGMIVRPDELVNKIVSLDLLQNKSEQIPLIFTI